MLYRPASRLEACCFKGTTLQYYWDDASQGWPVGYYPAFVADVPLEAVEGDEEGIYLSLEFADQEKGAKEAWQDVDWEEFADPQRCRILNLSENARAQQLKQRRIAAAKGKQIAGDTREDPHEHLFRENYAPSQGPAKRQKRLSGGRVSDAQGKGPHRGRENNCVRKMALPSPVKSVSINEDAAEAQGDRNQKRKRPRNHKAKATQEAGPSTILPESQESEECQPSHAPKRARRDKEAPRGETSGEEDVDIDDGGGNAFASNPFPSIPSASTEATKKMKNADSQPGLRDIGSFPLVKLGAGMGNAGHVKKLELQNFMCHEHLVVNFNPRLNFICGENGSGKTAVLHGLQTCLGVSAKKSGRATSGGELIRDGANYSRVSVTLWNTGADAYCPKKLGHEVTVVREMRRTPNNGATSTWGILDASGKKAASRRADVDDLLSSLNVNAGNPIVCLTQDTARSFGSNRADAERFQVFMEATQFDVIIEKLKLSEMEVESMKARRKELSKTIKEREGQLKEVQRKLEEMEEAQVWIQQKDHIGNWLAWEHYLEPRRLAAEADEKINGLAKEKMDALLAKLGEVEDLVENAREQHEAKKAAIANFPEVLASLQEEHRSQQALYHQARKDCIRTRHEIDKLNRELQEKNDASAAVEESILEMRAQLSGVAVGEESAIAVSLRQTIADAEGATAALSNANQEARECKASVDEADKQLAEAEMSRTAAQRRANEVRASLQRLRAHEQGNPVELFAPTARGGRMTTQLRRLMELIDNAMRAGRFSKPPLGPVGSLLTLTDDHWAVAVEHAVGRSFSDFLVHCHADAQLLKELARSVHQQYPMNAIIFPYDIPPHNPANNRIPQIPDELPTVYRVLKVKDMEHSHVVENYMMDYWNAERLLLVENDIEGIKAIRGRLAREGIMKVAWDVSGWRGYRRGNNETSFPPANQSVHARLRKDVAGAIMETQCTLSELEGILIEEVQKIQAARAQLSEAQKTHAAAKRAVADAQRRKADIENQVVDLRTQHESQKELDESSLDDLNLQLADIQREMSSIKAKVAEKKDALTTAAEKEGAISEQVKGRQAELDAQIKLHEIELQAQAASLETVQEAESEQEHVVATIEMLKEKTRQLEEKKAELLATSKEHLLQAREVCSEDEYKNSCTILVTPIVEQRKKYVNVPEEERPKDSVLMEKWNNELDRKIAATERIVGSNRAELEESKLQYELWLQKRMLELEHIDMNYSLLQASYQFRRENARKLRKSVLHAVETSFNNFLNQRGFTGSLIMDRENHQLALKVKADPTSAAITDMKSLSGGERSFTSMCFIMAVGQSISSPFHVLDEFDVFMDALNRRKAIEMLMRFGAMHGHLQLILLTPQSPHMIEDAKEFVQRQMGEQYPRGDFILTRAMGAPRARPRQS